MQGRRLATTDAIVAIVSPGEDSEAALARLEAWTTDRGIDLATVDVGEDIGDVYDENRATLGVTIGGDGTFLEGIKTFAPRNVPQLGINTGTLAFLSRVEPENLEAALDEVIRGRAEVDSRQQVAVEAPGLEATGINDVMLEHVPPEDPIDRKITTLDVYADDEYVGEFEGTGVAVSTPTGSTGISLSANGPIHYPVNNHTLQLVPLHTHQLGVRPVVVSPSTELRLVTRGEASLLVDGGRSHATLEAGSEVLVTGADQLAHVVRTSYDDHFFSAISKKLGWDIRDPDPDPGTGGAVDADLDRRLEVAAGSGPAPDESLASRRGVGTATSPDDGSAETDEADVHERALRIATEAAEAAGEPLRELHGQVETVTVKSDKSDVVTEADHQADRIITAVIRNEFPDHRILSEEGPPWEQDGTEPPNRDRNPADVDAATPAAPSGYTWVVDPLDGTGNFAHGNPNYSVSIALLEDGDPVVGVVYVPETDELFSAIAGREARRNGDRIETTDRDRLDESMLISGYDPDGSFLSHFYQESRGVRRLGSAALNLCYLASGSADATWEHDTHPWDVAAGLVIARAAGATITDERGERFELTLEDDGRAALLGSNGPLHPSLLEHLEAGRTGAETNADGGD
ncbi:myo-inositol-1(or 4)-monophosphatase [Halobiforma haloterrestris]|uniref:NAD kinase n=1 Tax=Natronobacterium haloterrestre TaxID=148448 RepID=A0A1I1JLW4_NATHA|nr:inositol monophosphatase family protein [Halobiforma haloterrestris]SFC49466.1 myo-inositol-1(or 4)-monophosphatase [Halobiforma haloterrestris]